jgi:hypothetical protein
MHQGFKPPFVSFVLTTLTKLHGGFVGDDVLLVLLAAWVLLHEEGAAGGWLELGLVHQAR